MRLVPRSARLRAEEFEPRLNPVTLTVDAAANVHPIDPNVYGTAFASAAQLSDLNVPLSRNGGNASDTYSYAYTYSRFFALNQPVIENC